MKDIKAYIEAPVHISLESLTEYWPKSLIGKKVGAVVHPASVIQRMNKNKHEIVHSAQILKELDGKLLQLSALFGPQHGYLGQTQDNMIEWEGYQHPEWKIPVYSLYGEHREPSQKMLEGLDLLLVDLQDVGARYYTFIWTLYLSMQAAEKKGIPVVVIDRPNPINGVDIEGPLLNINYRSFVGLHPIPVRHGKTIGELALQFRDEAFPKCEVYVLPMQGWKREMWFEETGLPWVLPSPNMPTVDTAIVYPGMCLFEATNVSEGRGTTRPFELFGAPWIDGPKFTEQLNRLDLSGVFFREAYFQPTFHKFKGELCQGSQFHVTDRKSFKPWKAGLEILRTLLKQYPDQFAWKAPPYEYEHNKLPIEILTGLPLADTF